MTGCVLGDAAEAAWDEDGATPASGTPTTPVPRSDGASSDGVAHPSATGDVTRSRVTPFRHADPCDCGDPQHCGAFGCPCMTVYPDPASPCAHPTCNQRAMAHVHMKAHGVYGRHPHAPTLCRCRHAIEVAP